MLGTGGAGAQMCSPSELSGMGAAHDEQVTVGRMTEARSSMRFGTRSDILTGADVGLPVSCPNVWCRGRRWRWSNCGSTGQVEL